MYLADTLPALAIEWLSEWIPISVVRSVCELSKCPFSNNSNEDAKLFEASVKRGKWRPMDRVVFVSRRRE